LAVFLLLANMAETLVSMPKQLEIKVKARNNLLIQARRALGFYTQCGAAKAAGVNQQWLNGVECFRISPLLAKQRGWTTSAAQLAHFYGVPPELLWPDSLLDIKEQPVLLTYADVKELAAGSVVMALPPAVEHDKHELRDVIDKLLSDLTPKDAFVVRMRLGFDGEEPKTFKEIGEMMGVSGQMAIYRWERALRRLRTADKQTGRRLTEWFDDTATWNE
jgi:hypothetical protein